MARVGRKPRDTGPWNPISVTVDDRTWHAVREICNQDGVSVAAVMREVLDFWISEGRPVSWYEESENE
jgi:hypothetical protein